MKTFFTKTYDSESINDLARDVSEAFSKDFNDELSDDIREDDEVRVLFTFENKKLSVLVDKLFDVVSMIDIEDTLYEAIEDIESTADVEVDEFGFFQGSLVLTMSVI